MGELNVAKKDMVAIRQKMKKYAWKYAHLGIPWKVPAALEHAFAKAKMAKIKAEGVMRKLDEENNSPAAQKLKTVEIEAKKKFHFEEDTARGVKKISDQYHKELKKWVEAD